MNRGSDESKYYQVIFGARFTCYVGVYITQPRWTTDEGYRGSRGKHYNLLRHTHNLYVLQRATRMNTWNSRLKRRVYLRTRKALRRISPKEQQRRRELAALTKYLIEYRAYYRCELCGSPYGLTLAHIQNNRVDTAGNILIACKWKCHRHDAFRKGLPISQEDAFELTRRRNEYAGIDDNLTGADLLEVRG